MSSACEINPKTGSLDNQFLYIDLESVVKGSLVKRQIIEKDGAPSRAQRVLKENDILYQCVRPYQLNNYIFEGDTIQCVASTGYAQLRTTQFPLYIFQALHTKQFTNQVLERCTGTNYPAINSSDLGTVEVPICSLPEQVKIGSLLALIDSRIKTQSKIIEELTTLRSALYDSMFCSPGQEMPKFRIQSFSGKWQLCQLNDICSRKSIKNKDNLYSRVLTIAAQHGLVDQESFFKKRIASENLESYLCLEKGDFAYNKSYSSDYPWGAVKRLSNFDKGIISPLYICFTPKPEVVDPDYLAHYFESTKWHSGISEISGEGARNHGLLNMSIIDYFNTCHRIPGLDEQKAIAIRLNAIAHKLQTEQEYLELLNRQKDCFLKQMFI